MFKSIHYEKGVSDAARGSYFDPPGRLGDTRNSEYREGWEAQRDKMNP